MRNKRVYFLFLTVLCLTLAGCSRTDDVTQEETIEEEAQAEPGAEETSEEMTEKEDEKEESAKEETVPEIDLPGEKRNGDQYNQGEDSKRVTYEDGFYYEPISDELLEYLRGTSYPEEEDEDAAKINRDDLRYVHVQYVDFDGNATEGELICNADIAQDLVEIFAELYKEEYPLESIRLVDEYDGDDEASMAADNTSCFNYRNVPGSSSLSNHALGRAIDVNPLYNPYVTFNSDGSTNVSPEEGSDYEDREGDFPHKINEEDLCYELFTDHGFTWGGSWNSSRDYQHFEK